MILDDIVEQRKLQLQKEKDNISLEEMKEMALASKRISLDFKQALARPGLSMICEVKKASPSKGIIAEDFDPTAQAAAYEAAGADAISCLTEEHYFLGAAKYLADIRRVVDIPVLRKDFIIDEYQIYESKVLGADALLLIAAILDSERMQAYYDLAKSLGLYVLCEAHNEEELERIIQCGCEIIGINNRDLKTFQVDLGTVGRLGNRIPYEALLISESGMKTPKDMAYVKSQGADGVLVGETLMRSGDIARTIKELRES